MKRVLIEIVVGALVLRLIAVLITQINMRRNP